MSVDLVSITRQVRTIIAHHACLPSSDSVELSQVMDDFGFDSLDHVEIAIAIEDFFRIDVADEHMFGDRTTVSEVISYVAKKVGAK